MRNSGGRPPAAYSVVDPPCFHKPKTYVRIHQEDSPFRCAVPVSPAGPRASASSAFRLLLVLVPLFLLRACVITYVPPGPDRHAADRLRAEQGPAEEARAARLPPGDRGYETVHTFPRDIQVVEFTNDPSERGAGATGRSAAIKVPTVDGYPVDVDVTVLYRIADPYQVVSRFGFGRPTRRRSSSASPIRWSSSTWASCAPRSSTASSGSHKVQRPQARAARSASRANGLLLADVLIRQYDYPETFQSLTEQKKIQDQSVLANREFAKQAEVADAAQPDEGRGAEPDQRAGPPSSTRRSPGSAPARTSTSARSAPRPTCWSRAAEAERHRADQPRPGRRRLGQAAAAAPRPGAAQQHQGSDLHQRGPDRPRQDRRASEP